MQFLYDPRLGPGEDYTDLFKIVAYEYNKKQPRTTLILQLATPLICTMHVYLIVKSIVSPVLLLLETRRYQWIWRQILWQVYFPQLSKYSLRKKWLRHLAKTDERKVLLMDLWPKHTKILTSFFSHKNVVQIFNMKLFLHCTQIVNSMLSEIRILC